MHVFNSWTMEQCIVHYNNMSNIEGGEGGGGGLR